jgi:hypothetical protein
MNAYITNKNLLNIINSYLNTKISYKNELINKTMCIALILSWDNIWHKGYYYFRNNDWSIARSYR